MVSASHITSIVSNTSITNLYDTYLVDASSGSLTLTLPNITANGYNYLFRRNDNTDNIVTIIGTGGQTIDSLASITLNTKSDTRLVSLNNVWISIITPTSEDFQQSFHGSQGYETINNAVFTGNYFRFIYKGRNYYNTDPVIIIICFTLDAPGTSQEFSIRLFDLTNNNTIATITATATVGINNYLLASTTTFSNIPLNESVFDLQAKLNNTTNPPPSNQLLVRLQSLYIQFS